MVFFFCVLRLRLAEYRGPEKNYYAFPLFDDDDDAKKDDNGEEDLFLVKCDGVKVRPSSSVLLSSSSSSFFDVLVVVV